jgi:ribosomal 50S subunit-associated protein YjgA (DUF615 family)
MVHASFGHQINRVTDMHTHLTATSARQAALLVELAQLRSTRIESLREAFDELRDAQEAYLQATEQVHRRVIALALPGATDAH